MLVRTAGESGDLDWTMNEAAAVEDPAQARLERPVKAVSFGLKLRIGPKSLGQFTLASSPGRPLFAWRVFPRKHNYHGRRASRLAATPVCPNQRRRPQFACLIGGRLRDRCECLFIRLLTVLVVLLTERLELSSYNPTLH